MAEQPYEIPLEHEEPVGPSSHANSMLVALELARANHPIPLSLVESLGNIIAESHYLVSLAFDIRLPGLAPNGLHLDTNVSLWRKFDDTPVPVRTLGAVMHNQSGEIRIIPYRLTNDGALLADFTGSNSRFTPVDEAHAHSIRDAILAGSPMEKPYIPPNF